MIDLVDVKLVHSAVKTFFISYDHGILCTFSKLHISEYPFISIFVKNGLVYLHTPSIVAFCHRNKPDKFKYLTCKRFNKVFPNHTNLSCNKTCLGFRVINKNEFDKII